MDDFSYDYVKSHFQTVQFRGKSLVPELFTFAKATPLIEVMANQEIWVRALLEIFDKTIELKDIDLLFDGPPSGFIYRGRLYYLDTELSYYTLASLPKKISRQEVENWPEALIVGTLPEKENRALFFQDFWGITAKIDDLETKMDLTATSYRPHPSQRDLFVSSKEGVFSSIALLFACGWKIFDHEGKKVIPLTGSTLAIDQKGQKLAIVGTLSFEEETFSLSNLSPSMQKDRILLEGNRIGLLPEGLTFSFCKKSEEASIEIEKKSLYQLLSFDRKPLSSSVLKKTVVPSPAFLGSLREYQLEGVRFLFAHYQIGTSALLADDMGLGKTIQTLAFLSTLPNDLAILLIAPTTLLYNWEREIDRFLPSRKQEIHLVSYGELRAGFEGQEKLWDLLILDEAQAIKNRETQTHQKACLLQAKFRLSLTGTPIENHLLELHHHFAFLLPKESFSHDPTRLKRETSPYILRRRKKEVLHELPEKIEENLFLPLLPKQQEAYQEFIEGWRKSSQQTPMGVLEAILRLRQLALHPKLLNLDLEESVKLERLVEDVVEIAEEGLKVAIFSQFTSFLHIAQKRLASQFPTLLLDGSTPDRQKVIDTFQNDPFYPLILMNLRVGGVGINLTAADTIILLDPWWNDAQEEQAISRSHRMGRRGNVVARRYIAKGTIEEKMVLLKGQKRALSGFFLEDSPLPLLTNEELLSLVN